MDAYTRQGFIDTVEILRLSALPWIVIGGGSNLVVADSGYDGVVLRFMGNALRREGTRVHAEAGADLQAVVNFSIGEGLGGVHTMTGIPGWVGGAVYGNAGAYGRSMHQSITSVQMFDGKAVRELDNDGCGFHYRHSIFKNHKEWTVLSATLQLLLQDQDELRQKADEILTIRNAKYPPDMKCAGSIFKNLIVRDLPLSVQNQIDPKAVREGKVASAFFLEQVGAKGIRNGGIHVADYHANLIYNSGSGSACEVREIIDDLKQRVRLRFGFEVEEEVQYVGF